MKREWIQELLLQSLEVERGSARVYEAALDCVLNDDLRAEWSEYLVQTRRHEQILVKLLEDLGLDESQSPGRRIIRAIGEGLVGALHLAESTEAPETAEIAACECVVLAETLDHLRWELISGIAKIVGGADAKRLGAAVRLVEDEEDEHLFHGSGWCRELWLARLGVEARGLGAWRKPRRGREPRS
jgi:rubrerythrin